jgi:hypothetical protein
MARRTTAIIYGVTGQQLELTVRNGRPSAATFEVLAQYALDESAEEFTGSATIDTPNTTLSGAAGPSQSDPQRLPLTSVAGLVAGGRRYLLSQNGLQEWHELVEIGASYARTRNPLQSDFTTGATFQSTTIFAAVDDTFAANLNKLSNLLDTTPDYRVRWSITVGSSTFPIYSFFDLVRVAVGHNVELADLDNAIPGIIESMPVQHRAEQGRPLIDRAWSSVRAQLVASLIDVNILRDDEVIDELVILRTIRSLAEGGWAPPGVDKTLFLQTAVSNYDRFIEQHITVTLKHQTAQREGARPFGGALQAMDRSAWGK